MGFFNRQRNRSSFPTPEISEKKGIRYLHLGGAAVQSAMRMNAPYALELEYTRAMMAFLLFQPAPREISLLGLGGGSLAKFIHRGLPQSRLTVLEINPEVVDAARAFFHLPPNDAALDVRVGDGAAYVRGHEDRADVLLVDAYDAHRIVEALASESFYGACLSHLRPGGVAVFNLWGGDRLFQTYLGRLVSVFGEAILRLPAENKGNIQVMAFKPPYPTLAGGALMRRARVLEMELGLEFPAFLDRMRSVNSPPPMALAL